MNKIIEQHKNRPYAGESAAERKERRKQQFLDAGLNLFGTIGYRATTVRALCKYAKLTDRYFYESFINTEDLLIAVYQNCVIDLQQSVMFSLAQSPLVSNPQMKDLTYTGLNAFFSVVEDPRIVRVCWLEILGVSSKVDQTYNKGYRNIILQASHLLRDVYPHKVDDAEWDVLTTAVIGAISQSALYWLHNGYKISKETMVSASARILLSLFAPVPESSTVIK